MKPGIQAKLVGFTLLISIVMSGLIVSYALYEQQKEFVEDLEIKGRSMTALLAETLVGPIYHLRIDEASGLLAAVTHDPEVAAAYAIDLDGLTISSGMENEDEMLLVNSLYELAPVLESIRKKPQMQIQIVGEQLYATAPVQAEDGKLLGFVHLRLTFDRAIQEGRKAHMAMAMIALFVLVLGSLMAALLARHFSSQVKGILEGVQHIGQGKLDLQVPVKSADELGQLAKGINRMAQELNQHRNHLEELVLTRTAELAAARDDAEAASRAKSEFLASMSHELRTPLNAILGFSQLLGMDADLSEETKEQTREIELAGQHLLSLINDLIDLARIEAGKLAFCMEPVPVQSVVEDSLAMVAPIARNQGIELLKIPCHSGLDQVGVLADYVRLRQVVINLLSNAIKYNRPQGTVRLSCCVDDGAVRIIVVDTGPGIPADKQLRVFNAFDRLGAERGSVEGTGIGLVITRRIVEAMGGKIGFESVEGQGSSFWVEFPVCERVESHAQEALSQTIPLERSQQQMSRPVVLYIEDNPMNLRLMQRVFVMREDLELRDACTAEIGIELARAEPPALILMDINLPGMDGYAALAQLKSDPGTAQIPVIAVSANAMKGEQERGLKAGFEAYFTKPIDIAGLMAVLNRLFGERKNV